MSIDTYIQLGIHIFLFFFLLSFCSLLFYYTQQICVLIIQGLKNTIELQNKQEEEAPLPEIIERDIDRKTPWEEEELE